jgi:hypothetical protein
MPWLSCVVSNVLLALLLALAAWFVQRWLRRPAIAHVLWVLVLVKLVTPPLVSVPLHESPGIMACTLGTCGCRQHAPRQTLVRDTLPWVLLATWSAGAGVTGWTAWRRWSSISTTDGTRQPGTARMAIAGSQSCFRAFDSVPAGDSGNAGPIAAPGRSRPVPAADAAADGLVGSAQCVAEGRPAAARVGSYQARRPPGADAGVDGRRGLLVVAHRRFDRPPVARLRGNVLRRGGGGPPAAIAARLCSVAAGCVDFVNPLPGKPSHKPPR